MWVVMTARVLVVESHPVTRWGLGRLIAEQPDLEVAGDTGSAREAVGLTAALLPDVVVIGLPSLEGHGLPLGRELRERFDDLGVVILTATEDDDVLLQAFETGVSAYVAKTASVAEIVGAIRHASVAASSFTAAGLAAALRRQRQSVAACELSTREREVLDHLVAGRSVPAIAVLLHISPSTAKTYVSRVYEKLGARSRAEAVMAAVRHGLVNRTAAPDLVPV
jgi:DNA-binding NarL/FixJ family response regulator